MSNDLENLAAQAAVLDAETAPVDMTAPAAEPAAPVMSAADEAAGVIKFAVALFVPLFPSLEAVYTTAAQARLADVAGPVMTKYGLTMGGLFEKWGPEINLAIVAVPLAMETGRAMRADIAARQVAAKAAANEAPAAAAA